MTIATLVTRGYGTFGSISDVVTRGYSIDSNTINNIIGAAAHSTAHLVEIEMDAATHYLTDYYRKLTFGGNIYSPAGQYLGFTGIEEVIRMENNQVTISLSGVDQNFTSVFLGQDFIDRTTRISRVWIDTGGNIVADDRRVLFEGRIDQPIIQDDPSSGTTTIALSCSSHWIDFERINIRRYSHEEQQFRYSGDKGLEFVSEIPLELIWGRK